jgi:hypothetical protein
MFTQKSRIYNLNNTYLIHAHNNDIYITKAYAHKNLRPIIMEKNEKLPLKNLSNNNLLPFFKTAISLKKTPVTKFFIN